MQKARIRTFLGATLGGFHKEELEASWFLNMIYHPWDTAQLAAG
jgi:hypothetical protein